MDESKAHLITKWSSGGSNQWPVARFSAADQDRLQDQVTFLLHLFNNLSFKIFNMFNSSSYPEVRINNRQELDSMGEIRSTTDVAYMYITTPPQSFAL